MGGLGEPVEGTRGVPAYFGVGYSDEDAGYSESDMTSDDEVSDADWWTDDPSYKGTGEHGVVSDPEAAAAEGEGGIGWMGFGTTGGTPDWTGKTWGVQDPATGKSLQDKGLADSFKDMGWMDYLGAMLNPQGAALGLAGKGLMAAYEGIKGNLADKAALQDIIDDPLTSASSKAQAQEALDKHDKGYFDPDDPHDSPTEEAETKIKKVLDIGEEEEEEGRWDKYYEDREDRDPYEGYEYILEDVYGKDWQDRLKEGII